MAVIIEQLWDTDLRRPVRVSDVDSRSLHIDRVITVTGDDGVTHRYKLYRHERGDTPYDKDSALFKKQYNDAKPPFRLYTVKNGVQTPDIDHLAYQFHTRWGDGYFTGFFIGGYPPIEYFWKRRWITKQEGH